MSTLKRIRDAIQNGELDREPPTNPYGPQVATTDRCRKGKDYFQTDYDMVEWEAPCGEKTTS